jgi:hypothetical protein
MHENAVYQFVTVTVAVPDFPSDVAVIVAVPTATPLTTPLLFTMAVWVGLEDQVTVRPVRMLFAASRSVAVSVTVLPRATVAGFGVTVTVATGAGVTVTLDEPDAVPPDADATDAVMVAVPVATPVTNPLELTVAVCVAFEAH